MPNTIECLGTITEDCSNFIAFVECLTYLVIEEHKLVNSRITFHASRLIWRYETIGDNIVIQMCVNAAFDQLSKTT